MPSKFSKYPANLRLNAHRRKFGPHHGETGKSKGLVPLPKERIFARRSRSYKIPDYESWCMKSDVKNKRKAQA